MQERQTEKKRDDPRGNEVATCPQHRSVVVGTIGNPWRFSRTSVRVEGPTTVKEDVFANVFDVGVHGVWQHQGDKTGKQQETTQGDHRQSSNVPASN